MRIGAIDIGSNSTRLLLADVDDGAISEISRRSIVTRLGDGVDKSGALNDAAIERVMDALEEYAAEMVLAGCDRIGGVATSAVREASNGHDFADQVGTRHGIPIEVIGGDQEAQLTFLGASTGDALDKAGRSMVVDIGGGSTEFIVGSGGELLFHESTKLGAVRQSERWLHSDPPTKDEIKLLLDEAQTIILDAVPTEFRRDIENGIGVAGTPTVLAAVDQALVPFDPWKVHGYPITTEAAERLLDMLAGMPLEERRQVPGLHPDRAPTIVAGAAILLSTLRAFKLDQVVVSEHDILYGVALTLAAA
ncbi:MAG: Ppx/GppA family phosphatase [Thermoleophilaceae bacterium]|nr:Ppx/GppA family phosphatase [Thermoleophilaceae bacterium]